MNAARPVTGDPSPSQPALRSDSDEGRLMMTEMPGVWQLEILRRAAPARDDEYARVATPPPSRLAVRRFAPFTGHGHAILPYLLGHIERAVGVGDEVGRRGPILRIDSHADAHGQTERALDRGNGKFAAGHQLAHAVRGIAGTGQRSVGKND